MKKLLVMLLFLIIVSSCYTVRVVKMYPEKKSSSVKDSVFVTYDFWSVENTNFTITIHNNSSKPIYVDWNKSRLFINDIGIRYWNDIENKSFEGEALYIPRYNVSLHQGRSVTTRPEKVTFLVPYSSITISWGSLPNILTNIQNYRTEEHPCTYCRKKKTKEVRIAEFTQNNTLLTVRNYVSYSFREDFKEELSFDDYWWANQMLSMRRKQYRGKRNSYPYKTDSSYYFLNF